MELCTINIISTGTLNLRLFHVYIQKSLTQFHTLSLSLSISHSLSLDMLNNFYFHVYAQNSLFIGENVNVFISWEPALETLNSQAEDEEVKKKHCNFRQ